MAALVPSLPSEITYASLRAPYRAGRHYGWFAQGRPFTHTVEWFEGWLDAVAAEHHPIVLVGFSAGAAFAGGAILVNPDRYGGAAILCGTLPFDAGLATPPSRLKDKGVFVAHSLDDPVMPHDLLNRAWDYLTRDSGAAVQAEKYQCGHEVTVEVLKDLAAWLRALTLS